MPCARRLLSILPRALALAAALVAGCDRGRLPVEIGPVRAEGALAEPLREAGIEPTAVEAAARDALTRAGFRAVDSASAHRARVEVLAVRLAPSPSGGAPRVELLVEIALAPQKGSSAGEGREAGSGAAAISGRGITEAWKEALAAASRQAADGLAIAYAAETKPLEAVIQDLDSNDARVRGHAVRVLSDRGSASAVPALVARLDDPDPDVMHRAVGALARIRDARAVGPLIDLSQGADGAFAARLARVIGDIGGSEATGYLLTLEGGHPDPRVQDAAREALAEMRARAAEPPVAGR